MSAPNASFRVCDEDTANAVAEGPEDDDPELQAAAITAMRTRATDAPVRVFRVNRLGFNVTPLGFEWSGR
jgi:hypothetical protein